MRQMAATTRPKRLRTMASLAALWLAGAAVGFAAEVTAATNRPAAMADESVVLDHATMWRFFRVHDAAHVRHTNGVLARAGLTGTGHEW